MAAYIKIEDDTIWVYSRVSGDGGWVSSFYQEDPWHSYEGTIRIYGNSSNELYGQYAKGTSTSFRGPDSSAWMDYGTRWYWAVSGYRNSTQLHIENFDIRTGLNHYYTDSPRINALYTQELVEVADIATETYKNIYQKAQIPADSTLPDYVDTDLKTRWRIPTY